MPDQNSQGASLEAEVGGQKFAARGLKDPNTIFTVLTFVGVVMIAVWLYRHSEDARDANSNFVAAVREQTAALREQTATAREQNCLMRFGQERAEFCRQISR